jgi:hypothetical protein
LKIGSGGGSPRAFFQQTTNSGGDFTFTAGGTFTQYLSFGMNDAGSYGGTAGTSAARTIYFYDRVGSYYLGALVGADKAFYWGVSNTDYQFRTYAGNAANVSATVRGYTSQSADIFQVLNSANTVLLNVNSSGSVGISTTSPAVKFHITGGAAAGTATIRFDTCGYTTTPSSLGGKTFAGWLPVTIDTSLARFIPIYL